MTNLSVEERFWARVNKSDECWNWTGKPRNSGYGFLYMLPPGGTKKKQYQAHRLSYELAKGPIPEGMSIDHICHNRMCVNPDHLRPVTHKQNHENRKGASSASRSGVRGVRWRPGKNKWVAEVRHSGKQHYAGSYDSLAEAEAAVIAKRNELFTHNDLDRQAA
ncbi:HNH endonuclease [Arthrobacter sp. NPDC056886]|uniref:HNH endonuclease n=1 Tax=Arthrobacter sp. NPDC056886 TaxID=3345960 RepID=UPI00366DCF37